MRILRAHVPDFGPLRGLELELDPGLNVVYGGNEAGKTTLLDFLLAHLFRWERRKGIRLETVLGDLDRFGDAGETEGGVELRLGGQVYRYPDEGPSLLHHLGLEHAGLAGLFCVRSGELELPEKETGDFWRELKKVLSGLPEGVETLKTRAHEAAGLTAKTGELSDSGSPGRKTRHAELGRRIERLQGLVGHLDEVSDVAEEMSRLERRRERLDRARVARVAELSGRLRETREELEASGAPAAGTLRTWERVRAARQRLEGELETRRGELREAGETLEERKAVRREAEREAERLEERVERVREADLEERARRIAETDPSDAGRPADVAFWAGGGVLAVAIGASFFTPSAVLSDPTLLTGLLAALAVGALAHWWGRRLRSRRDARREALAGLREDAAACGLDDASPEELPAAVRGLEREAREAGEALTAARVEARNAVERQEERASDVEELEGDLEEAGSRLEELRQETGFDALEEARQARERAEELRDRSERLEAALRELAGPDPEDWDVEPPETEDGEELPDWSSEARREVDDRLRRLASERRELERAFDQAGLDTPEDVLPRLQELRAERDEIELDREAGRLAGEIFSTMGESLERRLTGALEREGPHSVGGLVRRITGRYARVERDGDELTVHDEEGRSWPLHRLSRGTRDQVYLALRLGLARSALEAADLDEPGFFLLDDAFLTADWTRRGRLVEAVEALAGGGWQVIYLTCDDHLRDLLVDAGAKLREL